jgi:predicted peptidase
MRKWWGLMGLICLMISVHAQDTRPFEKQIFIQGNDTLRLRILTPVQYSPKLKYPVVIFLHGAGERGNDNEAQLKWGASLFLDSMNRAKYPAIIIFPQCPADSFWANMTRGPVKDSLGRFVVRTSLPPTRPLQLVCDFLDTLMKQNNVDGKRIYIGGLSLGGFGTFDILWRRPDIFAAAFPICGGGEPQKATTFRKRLPIWIFHGDADPVVPVANSRRMVSALKSVGAKVKYTEYAGVGHDSWINAFMEPQLMPWLFSQRRK